MALTLAGHVLGLALWVGGLLAVVSVLAQHGPGTSRDVQLALGALETRLLNSLANPGAVLTVATGVILVALDPHYYLHALWLYAKLVLVLALGVLHGITYARCRALREVGVDLPRRSPILLLYAIAMVFVAILVFALPGEVYLH